MNEISKNENGFGAVGIILIIVILALIGAVGYLVYKNQHQTTVNHANVTKIQSTNTTPTKPNTTTDTLPNGTKITYPLTPANANVVWWSDGNNSPSSSNTPPDGYMRLTDKRIIEFLSTIPTDTIQSVCSSESDNTTGFQMGFYDTDKKELVLHNQYGNCIDEMITNGGKYSSQAQKVKDDSTSDLQAWANSLTVTK
ncbi:MAG TPA: hypothetical protein VLF79_03135 [Candidatus Saccharimonadales bacterium]|nr:hypothetical protein [Candidatus Saccharimonadales bacterium]